MTGQSLLYKIHVYTYICVYMFANHFACGKEEDGSVKTRETPIASKNIFNGTLWGSFVVVVVLGFFCCLV